MGRKRNEAKEERKKGRKGKEGEIRKNYAQVELADCGVQTPSTPSYPPALWVGSAPKSSYLCLLIMFHISRRPLARDVLIRHFALTSYSRLQILGLYHLHS